MAVKIRLTRLGKIHAPVYRIVAIDSRKSRDGEALENLGTYNPLTKQLIQFHADRIAYWVSKGAIVTDSVARLMKFAKKSNPSVSQEAVAAAPKKAAAKKTTTKKAPKAQAAE